MQEPLDEQYYGAWMHTDEELKDTSVKQLMERQLFVQVTWHAAPEARVT